MNEKVQVLDHGYVRLIDHWGSDESIIAAARMSTQKGFEGWGPTHQKTCAKMTRVPEEDLADEVLAWGDTACTCTQQPGDEKLLAYLYKMKHLGPFEMAGMTIEVQAPIFVFREWVRHRTQSFNEMSARYAPLPDVNYIPTVERLLLNSKTNKQAGTVQGAAELNADTARAFRHDLAESYADAESVYQNALAQGVPKELARLVLPVGRYSRMRASANLRNWMQFLTLRLDQAAQYEIQMYAIEVGKLVEKLHPRTWALFAEGLK
jgi:thymidylate synthase (FAD)